MAYKSPVDFFLTSQTLPYAPFPNNSRNSKSFIVSSRGTGETIFELQAVGISFALKQPLVEAASQTASCNSIGEPSPLFLSLYEG